jgi:NAD(P)H-dependent FMN reductase
MATPRPLLIPVLLGTPRQGRMSKYVARFVLGELSKRDAIETTLIDIRTLAVPITDAGEALKDPHFSAMIMRADALVLVVPEYNRGYPGLLKHVLDTNLKEYIHKAVGICGVPIARKYFHLTQLGSLWGWRRFAHCQSASKMAESTLSNVRLLALCR